MSYLTEILMYNVGHHYVIIFYRKKLSKWVIQAIRCVIDLLCRTMAGDDKAVRWFICLCCRECNTIYTWRGNILLFIFKIFYLFFSLKEPCTLYVAVMLFMMKYNWRQCSLSNLVNPQHHVFPYQEKVNGESSWGIS